MIEFCSECNEATGNAGCGEDSLFVELDDVELGPLCVDCYYEFLDEIDIKDQIME